MEACNVVRIRVKPEFEAEFLATYDNPCADLEHGLCHSFLVRTGEHSYCLVSQWYTAVAMRAAEPVLMSGLDRVRHMLEDAGDGRGAAECLSGQVVARHRFATADGEYWSG